MGLGSAVLPVLALVASLAAAVAVGSLVVAWLRRPDEVPLAAATDPLVAGLLPVGFVSGRASERWLPATVMRLACDGAIVIEDRRAAPDGEAGPARDIHLVSTGRTPEMNAGAPAPGREEGDAVVAILSPGLAGGSSDVVRGSSVDVDRVTKDNGRLAAIRRQGFLDAAQRYRERRPAIRLETATVGGTLGIALGLLEVVSGDGAADSIAWFAVVVGAVALGMRVVLPRWIPLNAAGLRLRERADELRATIAGTSFRDVAAGEQLLPWAVLLDEPETIRRYADVAERSGTVPDWYATTVRFSAARLASCLASIAGELTQPVRLSARLPGSGEGRSGVPLIDDHKGWGGGYFAGDGGPGGGYAGDGGGFDGGFGGGGFDGGGFGGDGGGGQ